MKKVSIIIPVYNVERYLRQCLESALNQTLSDIEIICVNDGSTDGSYEILQEVASKDSRVQVISKANSGYGHTMNVGIDAAQGKYIVFLESDDYILPDMCEEMLRVCEEYDLDFAKSDYYEFKSDGSDIYKRYMQMSYHNNYHRVTNAGDDKNLFYAAMYTWTCMYNREFLLRHNIRHNETQGASFQDNGFWFQSFMYADRVYLMDKAFYMYRQDNPNSSIHSKTKVYAFSEEYKFIRNRIKEYPGDKSEYINICAFFNLNHNMNQLTKVAVEFVPELINLVCNEFQEYTERREWRINALSDEFRRRLLICMTQPEALMESIVRYHSLIERKEKLLGTYNNIIIYGAGNYAQMALIEIRKSEHWNKDIICAVTSLENANIKLEDVQVEEIGKLTCYNDEALVIVCVKPGSVAYQQMHNLTEQLNFKNVINVRDIVIDDIWSSM